VAPMRIYIAGPMTGIEDYNLPAFAAAALELDALGYQAVNPGHRGVIDGYTWQDYLRDALQLLLTCEGVALLDGWENSRGATLEKHVADALDMPVHPLSEWIARAAA
jgi:hypothetical protein